MKRLSRLAACLLVLTLTACTAAETAVPRGLFLGEYTHVAQKLRVK